MLDNDRLSVCYASSNEYAPYTGVSIFSLLYNNKDIIDRVYLLSFNMSQDNISIIRSIVDNYECDFVVIDALHELGHVFEELGLGVFEGSYATYARAFISEVITEYSGKLLYIDSDTIVDGSLTGLLDINMGNNIAYGAVLGMNQYAYPYQELCIYNNKKKYYACGVILFQLNNWRSMNCTELIMDYLKENKGELFIFADQTVINNAIPEEYAIALDIKYNYWGHMYRGNRIYYELMRNGFYSRRDVDEAKNTPIIIHYKGHIVHPWLKGNISSMANRFMFYRNLTPWKDQEDRSVFYDDAICCETIKQKRKMCKTRRYLRYPAWFIWIEERVMFIKHSIERYFLK